MYYNFHEPIRHYFLPKAIWMESVPSHPLGYNLTLCSHLYLGSPSVLFTSVTPKDTMQNFQLRRLPSPLALPSVTLVNYTRRKIFETLSTCSFRQHSVAFFLFCANILFSALFSDILILHWHVHVIGPVLHTCNIACKIAQFNPCLVR